MAVRSLSSGGAKKYNASDTVITSLVANTTRTSNTVENGAFVTLKKFIVKNSGTVKIVFDSIRMNLNYGSDTQVLINGVSSNLFQSNTSWTTNTFTLTLPYPNSTVEIQAKGEYGTFNVSVRNASIKADELPLINVVVTD